MFQFIFRGNDANRLMVCQMLIKMADISNLGKPREIHLEWAERVCTEFFEQGDAERRSGKKISNFMDRTQPEISRLQRDFIRNIVYPTANVMHQAKLRMGGTLLKYAEIIRF